MSWETNGDSSHLISKLLVKNLNLPFAILEHFRVFAGFGRREQLHNFVGNAVLDLVGEREELFN